MSTPCYAMSFDQFSRQAIAIVVTPVMAEGGVVRLVPATPDAEAAVLELHREAVRMSARADVGRDEGEGWARDKVAQILGNVFDDDIWYSRVPDGRPIILVKEEPARMHGIEAVVRQTHRNEVLDAARAGLEIPPSVVEEYQQDISTLFAQRNLPVS